MKRDIEREEAMESRKEDVTRFRDAAKLMGDAIARMGYANDARTRDVATRRLDKVREYVLEVADRKVREVQTMTYKGIEENPDDFDYNAGGKATRRLDR